MDESTFQGGGGGGGGEDGGGGKFSKIMRGRRMGVGVLIKRGSDSFRFISFFLFFFWGGLGKKG